MRTATPNTATAGIGARRNQRPKILTLLLSSLSAAFIS